MTEPATNLPFRTLPAQGLSEKELGNVMPSQGLEPESTPAEPEPAETPSPAS